MGPLLALALLVCGQLCAGSGELRLVGGGGRCAGRVELKHGGEWGSVCVFDSDREARWASVVCRQLGCGQVARASPYAPFGQGTGRIWLQPVFCNGTENALEECPHFGWGRHFCGHERDAWVTCTAILNSVRLVEGETRCDGWLELAVGNGTWRRVPADILYIRNFTKVCREMGCGGLDMSHMVDGTVYLRDINETEKAIMNYVLTTVQEKTTALTKGPEWLGNIYFQDHVPYAYLSWMKTAPAGIPHGADIVCSEQISVRLAGGRGRCRGYLEVSYNGTWGRVCSNGTSTGTAAAVCRQLGCGDRGWLSAESTQQETRAWLAWVGCEDGANSLWECPSAPWQLQSCGAGGHAHVDCEEDSDGSTETDTTPYPEGATSTGVPSSSTLAVGVGTVPVPTVLCVVLGTLLCLALGALAVLLCRARAWRRGRGRAADAISNAVYEELDYTAMLEYQEVPSGPGSLSQGWVKKLPYSSRDSMEGSDTEAAPDPPAWPQQGIPDGYDDVLDVPQDPPAPGTGDMSKGVAQQRWICVLPTGGISSPPSAPGSTRDPLEQPPGHSDYDDVGSRTLETVP